MTGALGGVAPGMVIVGGVAARCDGGVLPADLLDEAGTGTAAGRVEAEGWVAVGDDGAVGAAPDLATGEVGDGGVGSGAAGDGAAEDGATGTTGAGSAGVGSRGAESNGAPGGVAELDVPAGSVPAGAPEMPLPVVPVVPVEVFRPAAPRWPGSVVTAGVTGPLTDARRGAFSTPSATLLVEEMGRATSVPALATLVEAPHDTATVAAAAPTA